MSNDNINYPQRKRAHDNASPTTRDVNAAGRVQLALRLSAQHLPWDEIAQQAGYGSRGAAHKAVMRELERVTVKNVNELRAQELHMLNLMHQECWQMFMDRKNKGRLFAADRILAIAERRAKLMGLDTPVDSAVAANMVIVREMPANYISVEAPKE